MNRPIPKKRAAVRPTILVLALVMAASNTTAFAQSTGDGATLGTPVQFAINAKPLGQALGDWAVQSRIQLIVQPDLVAGKSADGLSGSLTPQHALDRLLRGSGLVGVLEKGAVVVKPAPLAISTESELPEIKVQASSEALPGELPKPYAGGQVARGGQLGLLGNVGYMDMPFNQSSYTAKLMQDQQARSIGDVLKNDPSVREEHAAFGTFMIRGFASPNSDILFNGLMGIAPTLANVMMVETIERIEVLKGPSSFLNGAGPNGNIGGTINIIPKRAGEQPLTQITGSFYANSQVGGHIDIARRFGSDNQFGLRVNGLLREGDTAIDRQSEKNAVMSLAFDYRSNSVRLTVDLGRQHRDLQGVRAGILVAAGAGVPPPPDSSSNYNNSWNFERSDTDYGTVRGEFDINEHLTAFGSYGRSKRTSRNARETRTVINAQGNLSATNALLAGDVFNGEATEVGARASFKTGAVGHKIAVAHTTFTRDFLRTRPNFAVPASNLYQPVFGSGFDYSLIPSPEHAPKIQDHSFTSISVADTLSAFDDRLLVTIGLREQQIEARNFNAATGVVSSRYDQKKVTPMAGVVIKPWQNVSLYGNFIQALQQGPTAPAGALNAGEIFAPFVTKQLEGGVKVDFGRITAALGAFQIAQPNGIITPATNTFGINGEQRNRGLEFNIFGEATPRIRILGGAAYTDSVLTKTAGGLNQGKNGAGVPAFQLNLGGEWDTPFAQGFTLTAKMIHTSTQFLDNANTQKIPHWTRFDIGARYAVAKAMMIRANIENVFNKNYWSAASPLLELSTPRTFLLSATYNF